MELLNRLYLRTFMLALLLGIFVSPPATSQGFLNKKTYAELTTALNVSALVPGTKATLALVLDVKDKFHVQAHIPLDKASIPFEVKVGACGAMTGDIIYPAGEVHTYGFGQAKVYSGKTYILIPIEVPADAAVGEVKIVGKISYQACDNESCYPPIEEPFSITTKIVPAAEKVEPANADVFKAAVDQLKISSSSLLGTATEKSQGFLKKKTYATLSTALNVTALQPGSKANIVLVFDVKDGFHAQAHLPLDKDNIPLEVKLSTCGLLAGDFIYPAGEVHTYGFGQAKVYSGKTYILIPIEVSSDAKVGEVAISGMISYQACDNESCYQPMGEAFSIVAKIVAGSEKVEPANADLFKAADEQFKTSAAPPSTNPATNVNSNKAKTSTGWGSWFQNPFFIWPMAALLIAMGLGMFGFFTVNLPTGIYSLQPRHDTYSGNFLFGILTAVLSTPCTAPLFPGLLAWAILQSKGGHRFIGVAAIATVGVGMALPYLVLSAFPNLARKIPRTGPWSELIKQMMGFLIIGLALYFIGQQILPGNNFMWLVFATAVVAGIFLIVRTRQLMPRTRPIVISCLIALTITYGSFWLAQTLTKKSSINWQHFTDADLKAARDRKELTLVKFTAKWCANCQWIEANVFTSPDVIRAIADKKVTMLKNDRTKSDAPGTELLESLNAGGGIPLTAIYSPKRDEPYTLKSIYTTETFLQALNAAEKGSPFKEGSTDMTVGVALGIALVVGLIFNVMPCVLPVLPLKAIGFYEVSQHNRAKCVAFGVAFSLGIIATFSALALIVLPLT